MTFANGQHLSVEEKKPWDFLFAREVSGMEANCDEKTGGSRTYSSAPHSATGPLLTYPTFVVSITSDQTGRLAGFENPGCENRVCSSEGSDGTMPVLSSGGGGNRRSQGWFFKVWVFFP